MNHIADKEVTPQAFAPIGEVGAPIADGGHGGATVALASVCRLPQLAAGLA